MTPQERVLHFISWNWDNYKKPATDEELIGVLRLYNDPREEEAIRIISSMKQNCDIHFYEKKPFVGYLTTAHIMEIEADEA